jgi:hypothetical protein
VDIDRVLAAIGPARFIVRHRAHGTGPASGDSLSTRRSCGNVHIHISITAIVPTPPISADGTAPSQAAIAPARNSPSARGSREHRVDRHHAAQHTVGVRICTSD